MNIPGQIQYVFLLGQRDSPTLVNVPQDSICKPILSLVGSLPQTMLHFIYGVEFYELMKRENLQIGYNVTFLYSDATKDEIDFLAKPKTVPYSELKEEPMVLINCTNKVLLINHYVSLFKAYFNEKTLWVDFNIPEDFDISSINCAIAKNEYEIISWFISYALKYCNPDKRYQSQLIREKVNLGVRSKISREPRAAYDDRVWLLC